VSTCSRFQALRSYSASDVAIPPFDLFQLETGKHLWNNCPSQSSTYLIDFTRPTENTEGALRARQSNRLANIWRKKAVNSAQWGLSEKKLLSYGSNPVNAQRNIVIRGRAPARFEFGHSETISRDSLPYMFPFSTGVEAGGYHVKVIRRNQPPREPRLSGPLSRRKLYFFHERNTGVSRFHVEAGPDGKFPVDEAAGLLAMHCLVLGQSPQDYVVMVESAQESLEVVAGKVEELLQVGHSVGSLVKLTRRQEEVLSGVMGRLANKEIATSLNLSVRTVKFHLSSLLAKFRVRGREALALEVTRRTGGPMTGPQFLATRDARIFAEAPPNHSAPGVEPIAFAKRHLMA
jgi:DNA-binding CsgD family transcriptional regulator